jgi:hypothetical protein
VVVRPFIAEPGHATRCAATRRRLKDAERRGAILASLEWQYIVDHLSELSEVEVEQDGRRRADLRVQPIETSGETSPTA